MVFIDIWRSFRALPGWVQIWVAFILAPINLASLAFLDEPGGWLVALLAIGGMLPNMPILFGERGFSKLMALPHVLIWTPLLFVIWNLLSTSASGSFALFLWALLIVDAISLGFDFPDLWKCWKGDRVVARP